MGKRKGKNRHYVKDEHLPMKKKKDGDKLFTSKAVQAPKGVRKTRQKIIGKTSLSGNWVVSELETKVHATVSPTTDDLHTEATVSYDRLPTLKSKRLKTNGFEGSEMSPQQGKRSRQVEKPALSEDPNYEVSTDNDGRQQGNGADHIHVLSEGKVLVFLGDGDRLVVQGRLEVSCIWGNAECLGYHLTPDQSPAHIFSPDCSSLMTISATTTVDISVKHAAKIINLQGTCSKSIQRFMKNASPKSAALILKHISCKTSDFITNISPYQGLYTCVVDKDLIWYKQVQAFLGINPQTTAISISKEQQSTSNMYTSAIKASSSPIVVLCGGKNVGKSTFGRYLLNCSLNCCKEVAYMECDVGQTEFTPSGCVALNIVSQPIIGPPFTHQQRPMRCCFVGMVSPADDPQHYMDCVRHVYEAYTQLPQPRPPLIVNTMGWNKGVGLSLLAETLRLVRADLVLQLNAADSRHNLPPVDSNFLSSTPSWQHMQIYTDKSQHYPVENHDLISISVEPLTNRGIQKYRPADHRLLALLAHLSDMYLIDTEPKAVAVNELQSYRRPWNTLALHVCHCKVPNSQIMYALNASPVAMCVADTKQMLVPAGENLPNFMARAPVCECLGFAIVRAIDPENKLFHLLTPLKPEDLRKVNCLLKGATELPQSFILEQPASEKGDVPYVDYSKDTHGAASIKPRRHLQRRRQSPSPHHA